ncbi:hypothetical protein LCGC14_2135040 [marine sediment metagenome]|uniref:Uncharacterized protein n=1 Tax=marine sediment metagenome TaxID=412755 RepID=A0A0F9E0B8_9ZZZZ
MTKYFKIQLLIQELVEDDFITIHREDEIALDRLDMQMTLTDLYNNTNKFINKKIPKNKDATKNTLAE